MAGQEQTPRQTEPGSSSLPAAVWENMLIHVQEVAHQIEQRVQQARSEGDSEGKSVAATPSLEGAA